MPGAAVTGCPVVLSEPLDPVPDEHVQENNPAHVMRQFRQGNALPGLASGDSGARGATLRRGLGGSHAGKQAVHGHYLRRLGFSQAAPRLGLRGDDPRPGVDAGPGVVMTVRV
jgi:hypothetical protein